MQLRPKYANLLAVGSALALSTAALAAIAVEIDDSVPTTNERLTGGVFLSSPNLTIDDYSLERIAQGTDPLDFHGRDPIGKLSIVALGDAEHSSFDNLTFADNRTLLATEDRGDGLHDQLNRLDSVWAFDVRGGSLNPRRLIALGRDDVATAGDIGGCECDNEPTGLLVSDGSDSIQGLIGTPVQTQQTRWFVTQQHGRNQVWEFKLAEERRR